jgi:ATP-dependent exoDNAse (exonuclease V) beta subunit
LREQVKRPKEIKNHHLRVGELVHLAISTYFKKLKQGKDLPSSWLQSWVRKIFAEDQAYSKLIRSGGPSSTEKYPPTILDEQASEQLGAAIQTFFTSNALQEFRVLGAKPHSLIEHKMSLAGYKAPVSGKIDLVVHEEISATIVDWKLGVASDGGAESLQLASYGLWANAKYALPAEQIRIAKAHLADGSALDFKANSGSFANARARIQQDLERMTILHTYGQAGMIDVFTPSPHLKMCRLCPFRRICPEGEENHA